MEDVDYDLLQELSDKLRMQLVKQHGVAVAPHDPLLLALTGTQYIVTESVRSGSIALNQAIQEFRTNVDTTTNVAVGHLSAENQKMLAANREASKAALEEAVKAASKAATVDLKRSIAAHEQRLAKAERYFALVAAALLAAWAAIIFVVR